MVQVRILGTRGSVPVSGREFEIFGGATSAYAIEAGKDVLFLDAGTGIRRVPSGIVPAERVHLLLTHTHIDHILGLPFFLMEHCLGKQVEIWGRTRRGESAEQQLEHLFALPLWPAPLRAYPGIEYTFHEVPEGEWEIGPFRLRAAESHHPGGSLIYRADAEEKSLVLATDFEHGEEASAALAAFSEGADLILYDGQYTEENYPRHRNFGHSTPEEGIKILDRSGAGKLLVVHHDPGQTDEALLAREKNLGSGRVHFAREGEVITL